VSGEYRAVVFDFYGTLTQAVTRGAAHDRVALALGCDPVAFAILLDHTYFARARGDYGGTYTVLRWLAQRLGRVPTRSEVATAVRLREAAIRADIRLRPDAVPTLQRLRDKGLRIGLVTDCTGELPPILATLPIGRLIDAAVFSVLLGHSKPDPEMYETICEHLSVPAPECLYVGDGGSRELTGAHAAGMTAVRLAAPDLGRHLVYDPDLEFRGIAVTDIASVLDVVRAGREPALALRARSMDAGPY
jgi:putative hydrolase of the HAD superfamily